MVEQTQSTEILVIRPDRMGDVILSTPVLKVLKTHYLRSKITFMGKLPILSLVRGLPEVDDVLAYDPDGKHRGVKGWFELVREFKRRKFKIVVVLQSEFKIASALFFAGVRYRVGPWSKPHSFLFYNRGLRQRRSQVEMHEADYNLQLLRKLGIRTATRSVLTQVFVSEDAKQQAKSWLVASGVAFGNNQPLIGVHPGMGGSALNWPEAHYIELVQSLLEKRCQVLVTFGPREQELSLRFKKTLTHSSLFYFDGQMPTDFLGALLGFCDIVVAPSTGPLHLAVALEKPVVSFFPPIRVQSAIRWGPYLADDKLGSVLVPEMYCGEDFKCRGTLCHSYPCMKSIVVIQAIEEVDRLLAKNRSKKI